MRKHILFWMSFVAMSVVAQNSYDQLRFIDDDLTGTARFVGMGGAMSALGTDISVISTNPAGIGLYRSNDIAISGGLNMVKNSTDFGGSTMKSDKTSFGIDNMGAVLTTDFAGGDIQFFNIAANYRRRSRFTNCFEAAGSLLHNGNHFSQQYELLNLYRNNGNYAEYWGFEDYTNFSFPWLGLLTSTSALLDNDGNLLYTPGNVDGLYPTMMEYRSEEKGGAHDVDVNISCNINDKLYLGVTLGATYVDYTRYSEYSEFDEFNNNYHTLQNSYNVSGNGVNLKFGAIYRPFDFSPLKVGIAVHTPTWYSLTDRVSATMIGANGMVYDTRDYDCYGGDLYVDYDMVTPWRFNLSASYTFDDFAAIDAEYEYVDYSTAKLKYADGGNMTILNEEIDANMRSQHIFRVGAIFNINKNISFCCGYNYITAPFRDDAVKVSLLYTDTNTDFVNKFETSVVTLGTGYRGENWYFDAAYKLAMQKADFYNYYDSEYENPCADVKTERSSLVFTLGYRF